MRFHALLVVRDEADIISQSLRHLAAWADAIYVFDSGSCDETWHLVNEFAAMNARVVPLGHAPVFFSEKRLRGWVFHQARRHMKDGDWFVRVDADEFHDLSPPEFVRTRMRKHETVACHQYYDFQFTCSELNAWREGRETLADRSRPIEERRRWFTISSYTEPRLCRYRDSMRWPDHVSFPHNAGFVARERLPIRHYPHRDPLQLQRRCLVRAAMMFEPDNACNLHWNSSDWLRLIKPDGDRDLRYWQPGAPLPAVHLTNHLASRPKRGLQRLVHAFALPLLDGCRRAWSESSRPRHISELVQDQLRNELARING